MILTVSDRFKSPLDALNMSKSELLFFYEGACELNDIDNEAFKKVMK